LEAIVEDPDERKTLVRAAETIPSIRKKRLWAEKWITDDKVPVIAGLFAYVSVKLPCSFEITLFFRYTIIEGIMFSSSFASIFAVRGQNKFPALCKSNEWIARDEGLHTDHGVALSLLFQHQLPEWLAHHIMKEGVALEHEFVNESVQPNEPTRKFSNEEMCQYVCFVSDRLLQQYGYRPLYNVENPFPWMETIGLIGKSQIHEFEAITEYQRQ
jgi:ribonucleotide reductase beta subunit family protein with ferritin-like domain